jgi:hypothetical protein
MSQNRCDAGEHHVHDLNHYEVLSKDGKNQRKQQHIPGSSQHRQTGVREHPVSVSLHEIPGKEMVTI